MHIHYVQHVWFEDLGVIREWAEEKGVSISCTRLFDNEELPATDGIDLLVIMGGPMNIYEEDRYPWLRREKEFIAQCIDRGSAVLGICLGAQLIAEVLGGSVVKGPQREIGWWPLRILNKEFRHPLADVPNEITCFHWHSDVFSIPEGALHIAESDACAHQAFSYNGGLVLGLQFHLEMTREGLLRIMNECADECVTGKYIQDSDGIMCDEIAIKRSNEYMFVILNELKKKINQRR